MKTKLRPIQALQLSYEAMLSKKEEPIPKTLNLSLLSNPSLKDQQHFKAIHHELSLYNKKILDHSLQDNYEAKVHQKLFTITSDLANLSSKEAMKDRLEVTWKWWLEQKRKIQQRKDLGMVKYKTDRQTDKMRAIKERMSKSLVVVEQAKLPNQLQFQQLSPFQNKNRTIHKEMKIPLKRLSEYKVKRLNIMDAVLKATDEPPIKERVLYPKPMKYVPPEEITPENPQNLTQDNAQPATTTNPEQAEGTNAAAGTQGQPPPEEDPNKSPQAEDPNQQDVGLGQEPQQPGEEGGGDEQQTPQQDKLAPKNKIYTWSNKQRQQYNKQKSYTRPYIFYKGWQATPQRRMEEQFFLKQQYSLQVKREEEQMINKAHEWALSKQNVDKQRQFLLQYRRNKPRYSFSYEDPETKEMLSLADQKRFGFYMPPKPASIGQIVLDDKLPELPESKPYQREIRGDRLKSLKHKFQKMLNLKEGAEVNKHTSTLCQISPKRRDFSMILEDHSLQKQRLREIEEIQKIKQSLGKHRININIRALSQALVPDDYDYKQERFQSPTKSLISNPFQVEVKKKKKKK